MVEGVPLERWLRGDVHCTHATGEVVEGVPLERWLREVYTAHMPLERWLREVYTAHTCCVLDWCCDISSVALPCLGCRRAVWGVKMTVVTLQGVPYLMLSGCLHCTLTVHICDDRRCAT